MIHKSKFDPSSHDVFSVAQRWIASVRVCETCWPKQDVSRLWLKPFRVVQELCLSTILDLVKVENISQHPVGRLPIHILCMPDVVALSRLRLLDLVMPDVVLVKVV